MVCGVLLSGLGANVVIFVGLWGWLGVKKSTSVGWGVLCGLCGGRRVGLCLFFCLLPDLWC